MVSISIFEPHTKYYISLRVIPIDMDGVFDILSNEYKVLGLIFASNQHDIPIYQKLMVKKLKGDISANTIIQAVNRLFDLGLVNAKWTKVDGSKWVRAYTVTGEGSVLAKSIYEQSKRDFDDLF